MSGQGRERAVQDAADVVEELAELLAPGSSELLVSATCPLVHADLEPEPCPRTLARELWLHRGPPAEGGAVSALRRCARAAGIKVSLYHADEPAAVLLCGPGGAWRAERRETWDAAGLERADGGGDADGAGGAALRFRIAVEIVDRRLLDAGAQAGAAEHLASLRRRLLARHLFHGGRLRIRARTSPGDGAGGAFAFPRCATLPAALAFHFGRAVADACDASLALGLPLSGLPFAAQRYGPQEAIAVDLRFSRPGASAGARADACQFFFLNGRRAPRPAACPCEQEFVALWQRLCGAIGGGRRGAAAASDLTRDTRASVALHPVYCIDLRVPRRLVVDGDGALPFEALSLEVRHAWAAVLAHLVRAAPAEALPAGRAGALLEGLAARRRAIEAELRAAALQGDGLRDGGRAARLLRERLAAAWQRVEGERDLSALRFLIGSGADEVFRVDEALGAVDVDEAVAAAERRRAERLPAWARAVGSALAERPQAAPDTPPGPSEGPSAGASAGRSAGPQPPGSAFSPSCSPAGAVDAAALASPTGLFFSPPARSPTRSPARKRASCGGGSSAAAVPRRPSKRRGGRSPLARGVARRARSPEF